MNCVSNIINFTFRLSWCDPQNYNQQRFTTLIINKRDPPLFLGVSQSQKNKPTGDAWLRLCGMRIQFMESQLRIFIDLRCLRINLEQNKTEFISDEYT